MKPWDSKLVAGTLDLLILEVIAPEPLYGYRITKQVLERSGGRYQIKEGSLYPALHKLEREKLLDSYWVGLEGERRRKYYKVTAKGKKALEAKKAEWRDFSESVNAVLGAEAHGLG